MGTDEPRGRFETFDANEHYVVVRDDEGYGVWRLDDLEDGEPMRRFSDDDEGYEDAAAMWKEVTQRTRRERGVWLDRIRVAAMILLAVWVVASAVPILLLVFEEESNGFFPGDPGEPLFERLLYAVSGIAFDAWIAATIAYVLLWMDHRRRAPVSGGTDPG